MRSLRDRSQPGGSGYTIRQSRQLLPHRNQGTPGTLVGAGSAGDEGVSGLCYLPHDSLREHYHGARYVQVAPLELGEAVPQLDPQALNDSNNLRLAVFANEAHGQVLLTAVFDNLGKGASGAAVQNLELMLAAMR